jgi:hypothetical protein
MVGRLRGGRGGPMRTFGMILMPQGGGPDCYGTGGRAGVVSWEGMVLLVGSG